MPVATIEKTTPNPAAGAQVQFVATEDCYVVSLYVTFVTDANVANRRFGLQAKDAAGNIFWRQYTSTDVPASQTRNVCAFVGAPTYALQVDVFTITLPGYRGLPLRPGDILESLISAAQVGDDISAAVVLYERPER